MSYNPPRAPKPPPMGVPPYGYGVLPPMGMPPVSKNTFTKRNSYYYFLIF